jgi:hypothetical protein
MNLLPKILAVSTICINLALSPAAQAPTHAAPSTATAPVRFHTETQFDWDGDGTPDVFRLRVEKQLDFAVEGPKHIQSKEKLWWYHCWLKIESGADHAVLWQDEWSIKENDIGSFQDLVDFKTPKEFFDNWFGWGELNSFEIQQLTKDEISEDVVASELKRFEITDITPAEVIELIAASPESRTFNYRGDWREDLRSAVYVPRLKKVILYHLGYGD